MPYRMGTCTDSDRYNDDTGFMFSSFEPFATRDSVCARFPCAGPCQKAATRTPSLDPPIPSPCGTGVKCIPQAQLLPNHFWVRADGKAD